MPVFAARLDSIEMRVKCAQHLRATTECVLEHNRTNPPCERYWYLYGHYQEFELPSEIIDQIASGDE